MIENDLSLEHRKKINDFITLKSKDTLWSKFVLMLGIQMKTGLDPVIIVSIENTFNVSLSADDIVEMIDIKGIKNILKRKGAF